MKNKKMKNLKKLILLCFTIFINCVVWGQYGGGSGTSINPYLISTSSHLKELSNTPSDWTGVFFKLINDIDMSGETFTPIGNSNNVFSGTFNGNNKSITNLVISPNASNVGTGLFGAFRGSVYDLGLKDITVSASGINRVGAVAGYMIGGSIERVYVYKGSIDIGTAGWAGGLVGVMLNGTVGKIEDCFSDIEIIAGWASGGVVGATRGQHIINRVAFYGTITGNVAITTVQDDDPLGNKNGLAPTNAFYANTVGTTDSNAVSLTALELSKSSSYTTFDFVNNWKIDVDKQYATLILERSFFEKIRIEKVLSSDDVVWTNYALGTSGYCEEFFTHPTDANTMFMAPDMHAAYGSWDGGVSWQTVKDWDGNGLEMRRVIDMQFSLQNPNFGVAFANDQSGLNFSGRVYTTNDKGRTWQVNSTVGKAHSKLAIHPTNDDIWFLGAGDFWNVKANHRSLANPHGEKQRRANYGYVWKTTDAGRNWTKVATSISNDLDVGRIIFDRNQPNIMVMATSHGMYRSTDTGETWASSNTGLPNDLPRDLTSFYDGTNFILYAVDQSVYTSPDGNSIESSGGIFKSIDGGITWQSITGNLGVNMQTITDFNYRDGYHRTLGNWFGISKNVSKSTYTTYPTNVLPSFNRIVVNPTDNDEIYIVHNRRHDFSFGPGDVWKTEDGGTTWFPCARSGDYWIKKKDDTYWKAKNIEVDADNIDFAHLQREMDEGHENSSAARMLAININGDVFTGINQQLLRSTNGGLDWKQIDDDETSPGSDVWVGRGGTALPGRFMLLETGVPGRKLFCSGEHGLWKNDDLGNYPDPEALALRQLEGQNNAGGAHSISTVAVNPTNPDDIYFLSWRQSHRGKLRRSEDGGQTWNNIATIFEASNQIWEHLAIQYNLVFDPTNANNMYFCSVREEISEVGGRSIDESILTKGGYGFYKSIDGGFNWTLSNSGLPSNSSLRRFALHPDNPQIIYAALNQWGNSDPEGGLYKSINGGDTWTKVNGLDTNIKSVNNVFIDRNTKDIFISTGTRSGDISGGGVWKSTDDGATWNRIFEAPYIWQTEVSPLDSKIILISAAAQVGSAINNFKNPGVYLSTDGGNTWLKINKGLAHSDRIVDLKPDPEDKDVLWAAGWGSGWYKTNIKSITLSADIADVQKHASIVKLYPNPVYAGSLTISNVEDFSAYTIWGINGSKVKSGIINEDGLIDVSLLDAGIYVLEIKETGTKTVLKFIIE